MRETNICFFCVLNNAIIRLGGEGKGKGRAQLTWVGRRRRNATTTIFFPWVPQEHVIPPSVQGSPVSASVFFFVISLAMSCISAGGLFLLLLMIRSLCEAGCPGSFIAFH